MSLFLIYAQLLNGTRKAISRIGIIKFSVSKNEPTTISHVGVGGGIFFYRINGTFSAMALYLAASSQCEMQNMLSCSATAKASIQTYPSL